MFVCCVLITYRHSLHSLGDDQSTTTLTWNVFIPRSTIHRNSSVPLTPVIMTLASGCTVGRGRLPGHVHRKLWKPTAAALLINGARRTLTTSGEPRDSARFRDSATRRRTRPDVPARANRPPISRGSAPFAALASRSALKAAVRTGVSQ